VSHAGEDDLFRWLEGRLARLGGAGREQAFLAAVRGNLLFPDDARPLVDVVCEAELTPDGDAAREIAAAGGEFFALAAAAWGEGYAAFRDWTRAVAERSGRRGSALYMPLRAALTGCTHGPELAPLVALMGPERVAGRLRAAGALAAAA
jgi:glutamyl-tRNA synthetase